MNLPSLTCQTQFAMVLLLGRYFFLNIVWSCVGNFDINYCRNVTQYFPISTVWALLCYSLGLFIEMLYCSAKRNKISTRGWWLCSALACVLSTYVYGSGFWPARCPFSCTGTDVKPQQWTLTSCLSHWIQSGAFTGFVFLLPRCS